MQIRYHFTEPNALLVKIHGGHRTQRQIMAILGFNPQIHSGMAGKGKVMAYLTAEEVSGLKGMGFRLSFPRR